MQASQKDYGYKGRGLNQRPKKMVGDTEQKRLLGVAPGHKKRPGVILRKGLLGVDGLAKKGLPILFTRQNNCCAQEMFR